MSAATLVEPSTFTDDEQLVGGAQNLVTVGEKIGNVSLGEIPTPRGWWMCFLFGFTLLQGLVIAVTYLFWVGVGIWGINSPVFWGFAIINFVWWIGIGHAGTLISAILLLMHQKWRTSLNRFAEAMTLFAVMCAGMFPLIHMGRVWLAYWLFPFPNNFAMWPQFRSPLAWDVFAVTTYFTVSLVFWYIGLVPDFAYLRDSAKSKVQRVVYGFFALAGAAVPSTGGDSKSYISSWPASVRRWCSACTRLFRSTSPWRLCRFGMRQFFRRSSWPGRSSLASRW